jgi:peroxiredoxin
MKAGNTVLAAAIAVGFALSTTAMASPEKVKTVEKADAVKNAEMDASSDMHAADFTLTDLDGKAHHLQDYLDAGKVVVLEWFNPDCPFVKKHHEKNHTMAETYAKYGSDKVVWLAINSGAPGMQGNGVDRNKEARDAYGIKYPILLDENGAVGHAYGAKTTPHMFVIASSGDLLYRGAIDDNESPAKLGATNYVANCLAKATAGEPVEYMQTKSSGCSVKSEKKAAR